jgi:hypothetical protein
MDRYVIAVKRDCREKISPNWIGKIGKILGLNLDESAGAQRLVAAMTTEQRELIRTQFGELVHIELETGRYPSESS